MCQPLAETENSRRTREKPLVPRVHKRVLPPGNSWGEGSHQRPPGTENPGGWGLQIKESPMEGRRCWTRAEEHHGEKIKNGSFASDLRSVHISRYAIKIPGEIV